MCYIVSAIGTYVPSNLLSQELVQIRPIIGPLNEVSIERSPL